MEESAFRVLDRAPAALRRHPGWWALWTLSLLPFWFLYGVADVLALVLYRVVGYRRRVVRENLARSFPEKSEAERQQIERRFYRNLADILVETIKLCSMSAEQLARRFRYGASEVVITTYLEQGQTVLILGSHMGNWEWMLPAACGAYAPHRIASAYKPVSSWFAEALLTYLRTRAGGQLIRMQDVGRDVVRNRSVPRALCMIADQTPPGGEIQFFTRFLNQDTPFFVGGDKLAAGFRFPTFFLEMRKVRRGYYEATPHLIYDGLTPLPAPSRRDLDDPTQHPITERFARALEENIRRSPAEYLWSHKRWKNARPGR